MLGLAGLTEDRVGIKNEMVRNTQMRVRMLMKVAWITRKSNDQRFFIAATTSHNLTKLTIMCLHLLRSTDEWHHGCIHTYIDMYIRKQILWYICMYSLRRECDFCVEYRVRLSINWGKLFLYFALENGYW